jgi:hypothetical protein
VKDLRLAGLVAVPILLGLTLSACDHGRSFHARKSFTLNGTSLVIDVNSSPVTLVSGGSGSTISVQRWLSGVAAKPGHSSWTLTGDTLRLSINCTGLVLRCGSRFRVTVPPSLTVTVHSGSGNITGSALRLANVRATSNQGDITLDFASAPKLVDVTSSIGNVIAKVPTAGQTYRIVLVTGTGTRSSKLRNDPHSPHVVRLASDHGNTTVIPAS